MDHIVIEGLELQGLLAALSMAPTPHTLRVAFDEGGVKFKINQSMWSPALGNKGE